MAQPGGKIDLRHLLQIGRRWKWLLVAPPIVALLGAYILVVTTPPQYTSATTILFGSNQSIMQPVQEITAGAEQKGRFKITDVAENIRQLLLAENTLNKVIDRTGLKPSEAMKERAKEILKEQADANEQEVLRRLQLEWLAKKMETSLSFPKRGNYIQLSISHTNPDVAFKLTKNLAEVFIEESLLAESIGPRGTKEFAERQRDMYAAKLEESREKLRQFKMNMVRSQARSYDVDIQNEPRVNSQLKSLMVEIAGKKSQLRGIEAKLGDKKNHIRVELSAKAAASRVQMLDKISSLAELMVRADWRDAQVIKLNQELDAMREELQQEILSTGVNGARNGYMPRDLDLAVQRQLVLTDLDLLSQQKAVLDGLLQSYKQSLTLQPSQDLFLAQLQDSVNTYERYVKTFDEQARGIDALDALRQSDAKIRYKILDQANKPITPDTSDQPKILIMACFGGLGLGVGLVYLIEFFDHSFKSVEDVEQVLGLTVLGTVPKIEFGETNHTN
jgi:tyrosine-protein kinase Etk/Wzc